MASSPCPSENIGRRADSGASPTSFVMPDTRALHLYGEYLGTPEWPNNSDIIKGGYSHRRWHPLRREWVVYSGHRQTRTYKPATDVCPLCPHAEDGEIPVDDFSIAVFDNRFSSFQRTSPKPALPPDVDLLVDDAVGACEVIVYSSDHKASMASLSQDRRELLVRVWGDRVRALMQIPAVQVVIPFENRGEEAGVTLHHPHGQIYAFSYLPPVIETMARSFRDGFDLNKLTSSVAHKVADAGNMTAFVPPFARFPYEVWIASEKFRASPGELCPTEVMGCAHLLAAVAGKYDTFFGQTCPYVMIVYSAPRGMEDCFPFHIQFYPLLRAHQKLKYLAGVELGAGSFLVDVLPETAAKSLRETQIEEPS